MGNSSSAKDFVDNRNVNDDAQCDTKKIQLDDKELKSRLTPLQYYVTQQKGTERSVNFISIESL